MTKNQTNLDHLKNNVRDICLGVEERIPRLEQKGRCMIGPILFCCYKIRILRPIIFRMLEFFEGGTMFSQTLRETLKRDYGVHIGIYTYGTSLRPGILPRGTRIGNYCSIADGLIVLRRNHPSERVSQHPLFFNHQCGLVLADTIHSISDNPLTVGHDVWIGANVLITPGCKTIGNGAIVAAGTVVTSDVPAFAIVGGVPGRLIRWRFTEDVMALIEESCWWLHSLGDLIDLMPLFEQPMNIEIAQKLRDTLAGMVSKLGPAMAPPL